MILYAITVKKTGNVMSDYWLLQKKRRQHPTPLFQVNITGIQIPTEQNVEITHDKRGVMQGFAFVLLISL